MHYRFILLDHDGRLNGFVDSQLENDEVAIELSGRILTRSAYEIWREGRLVKSVLPEGWQASPWGAGLPLMAASKRPRRRSMH
jgi:hypothetical protein